MAKKSVRLSVWAVFAKGLIILASTPQIVAYVEYAKGFRETERGDGNESFSLFVPVWRLQSGKPRIYLPLCLDIEFFPGCGFLSQRH